MTLSAASARLPRWVGPVGVAAVVTTGAIALAWLDPQARARIFPGCPFRMLTGLDCPGCGGTRAAYALLQGDVLTALDHNLLTVVLLPVLVVAWGGWLATRLGWRKRPFTLPARVSMGLAITLTVFWVVRNLPFAPFAWLGSSAS